VIHSLLLDARRARQDVASGILRGPALVERLLAVPCNERDVWVNELLALPEPPPDIPDLPPGAVPYLPAGVEEILTLVREAPLRPDDELVDLGSGMGRVAILASLLSGARAHGVEIQRPLVDCARRCSDGLGLEGISFRHANAADAELDGSIFFLYAPFNGETMTRVLRRLERVARRRPMAICAVDLEFPGEAWLRPRESSCRSIALYDSRIPQVPRRSLLPEWYAIPAWRRSPVGPADAPAAL
jgi:hypothetical protein